MMKILFVGISGYQYPHVRVRCYHFARELAKHGFETGVLSFHDDLSPDTSEAMMYGLGDRDKLKLTGRAAARLLRARDTVIVLQKLHYHSAAPYLMRRLRLNPLVLDLDDWDENCLALFNRNWINRAFFGRGRYPEIIRRLARTSPFCLAASHCLQDLLAAHNPHVHLIETGVDHDQFPFAVRPEHGPIRLIWTGIVWGETMFRSVVMMIEAFARIQPQHPAAVLCLQGGGQLMPELHRLIADRFPQLPIEQQGWIDPREMPAVLHSAHIGLLPLDSPDPHDLWLRSKSPTKLFEYMSTGLPTVASAIGEVCHVIEDGQEGYLARSPGEFAEKLDVLLSDSSLRRTMGEAARAKICRKYSLKRLGERLAEVFRAYSD